MAHINSFEDIIAWQKAQHLSVQLYKQFSTIRDYGFRDQILRAVVSIGNNIAEGFERKSNKEFKQFLFIAKGSCGEVRSMLHLARSLGYVDDLLFGKISELSIEISKLLSGLIKAI